MLLKSVTVSGVDHVFACSEGEHDETLTIHVLQPGQNLSYSETLQKYDYQQRLKTLNARVKFPEASVRLILVNEDPLIAEEQPEHPFMIWKMKYFMGSSVASLKWEWHMIPTDGVHVSN
ncbi:uncharacterized protein LOC113564629 [Drosophila erecta]|uniref:uncharacterized protein LOC113564629 n=1 Tax=Drosophila erecta TaxID=7220 RepID=UPI000F06DCFA|nr:uncharacterized protein LOC113564629 [Drosophila erecta]